MKNLFLFLFLLLSSIVCQSQTLPLYRVVEVVDADTYTLNGYGTKFRFRVEHVDAPETNQPFGKAAKDSVKKVLLGKLVYAQLNGLDVYGRRLGSLYIPQFFKPSLRVDSLLISNGWAWYYRTANRSAYSTVPLLQTAETIARGYGVGLWACDDPVEPWVWRGFNARFRTQYWHNCPGTVGSSGGGTNGNPGGAIARRTVPDVPVTGTVKRSVKAAAAAVVKGTAGGGALGITGSKKQVKTIASANRGDSLR